MLRNYITVAFRALQRQRFFSLLNIGGLAIGVAACLLIAQYVAFELSYDDFHADGDRLYRLTRTVVENDQPQGTEAHLSHALAPTVAAELPHVEAFARWHPNYGDASLRYTDDDGARTAIRISDLAYTDASFLTMFSYPLAQGDPATALTAPDGIVLTAPTARALFGAADPMGQAVAVRAWTEGTFVVRGVLHDLPANTHLQFGALLPLAHLLTNRPQYRESNGWVWENFYAYVLLQEGTNPAALTDLAAAAVNARRTAADGLGDTRLEIGFQPVPDVHLFSGFVSPVNAVDRYQRVYFFGVLAVLILLIAWINYVNLATARATERAKEVGLRKTLGARRGQLVAQFMGESVLMNGLAFGCALVLVGIGRTYLQTLTGFTLPWLTHPGPAFWLGFVGAWAVGVVLANLYPAGILAGFQPATILGSGRSAATKRSDASLRRGLVVLQLSASVALLAGTAVVVTQIHYMDRLDLGLELDNRVVIKAPDFSDDYEDAPSAQAAFAASLQQRPSVEGLAASESVPGRGFNFNSSSFRREGEPATAGQQGHIVWVDANFFDVYDIDLIAGRTLPADRPAVLEDAVVINETAVQAFDFERPEAALGARIAYGPPMRVARIVGVMEDVRWSSAEYPVNPLFLRATDHGPFYTVKLRDGADPQAALDHLQRAYTTVFAGNAFEYFFADDAFRALYDEERRFASLLGLFAGLALIVALLGVLGLAAHTASARLKEMSIRRVLGARMADVVRLLVRDFAWLSGMALLIGLPLTYWAASTWLAHFATRITLGPTLLAGPGFAVLGVVMLVAGGYALKAAWVDPTTHLRRD